MITAKEWKYWLQNLGYPRPTRAPRRSPTGLVAMYGSVLSPKLGHIKLISRTGLYLQTAERWPIGEVVPLTLQKEGAAAKASELQIDVQARVASYGEDGVGLGFVLPQGLNAELWEHLVDTADTPRETEDAQFIFRMVRAILFLYRLCPSKAAEPIYVLTGEMDEFRTRSMLEIVLNAEAMLAGEPDTDKLRAHSSLVASILKDGSWNNDELILRLWTGLLVSSCGLNESDDSNLHFAELLVHVTPAQARILVEGCRRTSEQCEGADPENRRVIVSPEQMVRITGTYDLYRSGTDTAYLHNSELIECNFDFSTHGPKSSFDITPTPLGMKLFAACKGHLLEPEAVVQ